MSKQKGRKKIHLAATVSLNEFDVVIEASFAILLYVLHALQLSEDKTRSTSCWVRTVWWLFDILR